MKRAVIIALHKKCFTGARILLLVRLHLDHQEVQGNQKYWKRLRGAKESLLVKLIPLQSLLRHGSRQFTVMQKNQDVLREQLLPTTQEQFGDKQCLFQHYGAPCHKAKWITKRLGEQNTDILGPWPGNSSDLNTITVTCGQFSRDRWTNKNPQILTKSKHWLSKTEAAISKVVAQTLMDNMPGWIREVLEKEEHSKCWLFA